MPRAFDSQPLPVDRDPLRNILTGIPKQPTVDLAALQQAAFNWFNTLVGDLLNTDAWDDAKAKWDDIMSQIGALLALVNSGPVSAAQWAVWWSNTLIALGYDSTSAATIANWLSGNYDAAKTAQANWTAFMAAWGIGTPADVAAAAALNIARTKRKAQNDAIIADWLHQKYPVGAITDTAATLVGGKRTWWGAVNDNLLLVAQMFGLAQEIPDPTADVGTAATSAQATANTGVSNAGTAQAGVNAQLAWWQRLCEDLWIQADLFHALYPVGSPSDTPTTTSGGKRTWYSAAADLRQMFSDTKGTTAPAITVVSPGDQIQANTAAANTAAANASTAIASNQALNDAIVQASTGAGSGTTASDAYNALTNIPATNIVGLVGATVTWGATGASAWGSSPVSESHTPAPTDTSLDVIVAYYSSASTFTTSVSWNGITGAQVKTIQSTPVSGVRLCMEVWRIPLTPTASPPSANVVATVSASSGTPLVTVASVSYAGVKVNYSAAYTGSLASGANTLSMSTTSASDKRIISAAAKLTTAAGTFSTASGGTQRVNITGTGGPPSLFIQDKAGVDGGTTDCSVAFNLTSGSSPWVGLLIEMSN